MCMKNESRIQAMPPTRGQYDASLAMNPNPIAVAPSLVCDPAARVRAHSPGPSKKSPLEQRPLRGSAVAQVQPVGKCARSLGTKTLCLSPHFRSSELLCLLRLNLPSYHPSTPHSP